MPDDVSNVRIGNEKSPIDPSLKRSTTQWRFFLKIASIALCVALAALVLTAHPFLAVTNSVGQGMLVVEAWIPNKTLQEAARVFQRGSYRYLVLIGSQITASDPSRNYADLAAEDLAKQGVRLENVIKIVTPYQSESRTFAEAEAFRRWLLGSGLQVCCVEVFTVGVHARKSWITFEKVLGNTYRVGVIAGPEEYNAKYWPVSRRGLWLVLRNLSGYLYTRYEIAFRS